MSYDLPNLGEAQSFDKLRTGITVSSSLCHRSKHSVIASEVCEAIYTLAEDRFISLNVG